MDKFLIPISRRDFFKIAGLTTAGAILSNSIDNKPAEAAGIAAAYGLKNNISANMIEWDKIPESQRSYVSKN